MLLVEWIFSLSVFLYSLSDSLAPYLQRTAEDKCMRTRGIFPHSEQKQDIIASSKTFSTQPGKAVASPLTCDIYIFEGFLRNPPIFNMWIMNLWLCDAVWLWQAFISLVLMWYPLRLRGLQQNLGNKIICISMFFPQNEKKQLWNIPNLKRYLNWVLGLSAGDMQLSTV